MKRLVRLYPRAWRERYGAEIADVLARRRSSVGEILGLIRGALDAHLNPSLARTSMVFVPEIGFRPAGTRVLREPAETRERDTSVTIVAAAAGPDQTDVLMEWDPPELTGEDAKWLIKVDRSGVYTRPAIELSTTLIADGARHKPLRTEHRFRSANGYDLRELIFPPIAGAGEAALEIVHAEQTWRVPFQLVPSEFKGEARHAAVEREGITLAVTAAARHAGRVVVALRATIRQPGARVTTFGTTGGPGAFPAKLRMPSQRGPARGPAHPLVLHDDRGRRYEEVLRMQPFARAPEAGSADPWPPRRTSIFDVADHADAGPLALTVPCVVIAEPAGPVVVDLRALPQDFELGSHRLRALRTEVSSEHPSSTRIVFQVLDPKGPRQLLGPGRLLAEGSVTDMSFRGEPDEHQLFWMDTDLPDAPIVTLKGALVRVDGPWIFPIAFD